MKLIPMARESGKTVMNNKMATVGGAFTVWSGVAGYNDARAEGRGVIGSTAQGLTDALIVDIVGMPAYLSYLGASALYQGGKAAGKMVFERSQDMNRLGTALPFSTATHVDTEQSYTMRQAGLTQMQNNMFNTKKAIMGNEAMHMHR